MIRQGREVGARCAASDAASDAALAPKREPGPCIMQQDGGPISLTTPGLLRRRLEQGAASLIQDKRLNWSALL